MKCPTCGYKLTGFSTALDRPPRYFHRTYSCLAAIVNLRVNVRSDSTDRSAICGNLIDP